MNLGKMLKVFQYGILRQSGIAVTPDQLGLKSDPFAQYLGTGTLGASGNFASFLNPSVLTMPSVPKPPENPADVDAQARFNQEMIAYNQQMQAYNQRLMQMMLQQFNLMQQKIQSLNTQTRTSRSVLEKDSVLGTGGIIGGLSDL